MSPVLGVLTSGGDACGMNAAIRGIVQAASAENIKVYGIYKGYQGLIDGDIRRLRWTDVCNIGTDGGTMLQTARCSVFETYEGRKKAILNLVRHGINSLIVLGGDGSLAGALKLYEEQSEIYGNLVAEGKITDTGAGPQSPISIISIPATIDADLHGSDITLGSDTALHRISETVARLSSTMRSHRRIFVLETMGNKCGYLAMMAGAAIDADYVFLPEIPSPVGWQDDLRRTLEVSLELHKSDILIFLSEGMRDVNGNPIALKDVAGAISEYEVRTHRIGHIQRGGPPSAVDCMIGTKAGIVAAREFINMGGDGKAASERRFAKMVAFRNGQAELVELRPVVKSNKSIRAAIKRGVSVFDKRMQAFQQTYLQFEKHRQHKLEYTNNPKLQAHTTIGVLNGGQIAAGMNACLHALVQKGSFQNISIKYFENGFAGLERARDTELYEFREVSCIYGAAIGTSAPTVNIAYLKEQLKKHNIDWLVIIGSWENLEIIERMGKAILVPSLSLAADNSSLALGCDSALNSILRAANICRKSIEHGVKTVIIVEVSSEKMCALGAFAAGAFDAICLFGMEGVVNATKQQNIILNRLNKHFERTEKTFALVLRSMDAMPEITSDELAQIISKRGDFKARHCVLGPLGDGYIPSPSDLHGASMIAGEVIRVVQRERKGGVVGMVYGSPKFISTSEIKEAGIMQDIEETVRECLEMCRLF